ncbi:MAG: immune inhibitor A, partial [Muribaculaceae bacterium]|nr:immune inhibitor A [Muribaculaceae bacterium]
NKSVSYDGQTSGGTVTPDPTPEPSGDAIFSETFQSGSLGQFTVENKIANDWSGWYAKASGPACAIANSYKDGKNLEADSWLISPEISLEGFTSAAMSVKIGLGFYFPTKQDEFFTVLVQADGGEWQQLTLTEFPEKGNGNWSSVFAENKFDLTAHAGKKIRVAFRYVNDGSTSRAWELQDFAVTATK